MDFVTSAALVGEILALIGAITPLFVNVRKISTAQKCQLRSEMLRIYYHHVDEKTIRQYEYENFVALYEAYKVLKGNSFIEKVYKEIQGWKVVT